MFLTQEKVLKKIQQDRQKGDLKQALRRALDAHSRWPEDFELTAEAIQLSLERADYKRAVTLMKDAIRRSPGKRSHIIGMAREAFQQNFSPFLASFILESLLRSRNIDEIRNMIGYFSEDFIDSLIKRSETRSKGFLNNPGSKDSQFTDNEIFLGLLYMASGKPQQAVLPFERAFENAPEDLKLFGRLFIELERVLPRDSRIKFDLGKISMLLSHPEKAAVRFFQAVEFESPPLDELFELLESTGSRPEKHLLLTGEILIRSGREDDGERRIREYLESNSADWKNGSAGNEVKQMFADKVDGKQFAFGRIEKLPDRFNGSRKVAFLFCDLASELDRAKEIVERLEALYETDKGAGEDIAGWIEEKGGLKKDAKAQRLLSRIYIGLKDYSKASSAAILAAEINPGMINSLLKIIEEGIGSADGNDTALLSAKVELHTLNGNSEKAQQLIERLEDKDDISNDDLFRLTDRIIEKSGVNLERILSLLEMHIRNDDIAGTIPHFLGFYRENPEEHDELGSRIEGLLSDDAEGWEKIVTLIEAISREEDLSQPFRLLRAKADLRTGRIEKAVNEFDQLQMFDESLELDLIGEYEKAAENYPDNTTLYQALHRLYLDEGQLARATRYLCMALESDPRKIRDVIQKFANLVKKEPGNIKIWEEFLSSALKVGHIDLAGEILRKAFTMLPEDGSAALHIYGARISAAKGDIPDALRCISITLNSKAPDLKQIIEELGQIVSVAPRDPEARFLLGDTLIRSGSEDHAMKELEKCLSLSGEHYGKVEKRLKALLPLSIKPWLISRLLGKIAWKEGRLEDAYGYFKAVQNGPVEFLGSLDDMLEDIRKDRPDDTELTLIYVRSLSKQRKYDESEQILLRLMDEAPEASAKIMDVLIETLRSDPDEFHANRLSARIYSASGDNEKALAHILRILMNRDLGSREIEKAVKEFLPLHKDDVRFAIPYSGLQIRLNRHKKAISGLRRALESDRPAWSEILSSIEEYEWPEEFGATVSLLRADCLLEGNRPCEAFEAIENIYDRSSRVIPKMKKCIRRIIELGQKPEYYIFGSRLLAESGDVAGAEELTRQGCCMVDEQAAIDLKLELADALECSELHGEAARIYVEVLEGSNDKKRILRRIEDIALESARKKISQGIVKLKEGKLEPDASVRLAGIALDLGEFETALRFAKAPEIPDHRRVPLQARIYLYMDRPLLSLALAGSVEKPEEGPSESSLELLYIEGVASERIGDHGRAAAAFAALVRGCDGTTDCRERAERNYSLFLESQFKEIARILEKTGDIVSDKIERNPS